MISSIACSTPWDVHRTEMTLNKKYMKQIQIYSPENTGLLSQDFSFPASGHQQLIKIFYITFYVQHIIHITKVDCQTNPEIL